MILSQKLIPSHLTGTIIFISPDLFNKNRVETAFGFTFTAINTFVTYLEIIFPGRHADCLNRTGACA